MERSELRARILSTAIKAAVLTTSAATLAPGIEAAGGDGPQDCRKYNQSKYLSKKYLGS